MCEENYLKGKNTEEQAQFSITKRIRNNLTENRITHILKENTVHENRTTMNYLFDRKKSINEIKSQVNFIQVRNTKIIMSITNRF